MDDKNHLQTGVKRASSKRKGLTIGGIVIAVLVVLALALGLGLGLGLKKKSSSSPPSSSSSASAGVGNSQASSNVQEWRRSTLDYNLDFSNWDLNAEPVTRFYNLTVSEINVGPDGIKIDLKSGNMLISIEG
jgi:iron transport multicopper oxidase